MNGTIPGDVMLTVRLQAAVWQQVFASMGKDTYEHAQPLIGMIMEQIQQQAQQQMDQQQAQPQLPTANGLDPHPPVS